MNAWDSDSTVEDVVFNESPTHSYKVRFIRTALAPVGTAYLKPWTDIPKEIRDEVQGLMILKLYLTAEDVELFPNLKVYVMSLPLMYTHAMLICLPGL